MDFMKANPSTNFLNALRTEAKTLPTPCYLYFSELMSESHRKLRAALPDRVRIFYSVKANPYPGILAHWVSLGLGFDTSSLQELRLALESGAHPAAITCGGPGKSDDFLRTALRSEVDGIVIESATEMRRLQSLASLARPAPAILRVLPATRHDQHGRLLTHKRSQFGMDEATAEDLIREHRGNVTIRGLHFHLGSQVFSAAALLKIFSDALGCAKILRDKTGSNFPCIYLGGGFGVPFFKDDAEPTYFDLKSKIEGLINEFNETEFRVEAGRYLVGPSGFFVTKVVDIKTSYGVNYLIVDGGFSTAMAASAYARFLTKSPRIFCLTSEAAPETYTIAGPSCFTADVIADEVMLPRVGLGDILAIENMGAYGPSFSPSHFLGLPAASEKLVTRRGNDERD